MSKEPFPSTRRKNFPSSRRKNKPKKIQGKKKKMWSAKKQFSFDRNTLRDVAKETLKVIREGVYISPITNEPLTMKD